MPDVVRIGDATLYHEDCFELISTLHLRDIDAVITDPPYGCTCNEWDSPIDLQSFWKILLPVIKKNAACVCFSQMPFSVDLVQSNRKMFRYDLIYQKNVPTGYLNANRMPLRIHEQILIFYRTLPTYNPQKTHGKPYSRKRHNASTNYRKHTRIPTINTDGMRFPTSVMKIAREVSCAGEGKRFHHPTQKPIALMERLIMTYTNPGDTVLDPFMGSGSTGIAALKNGRKFIGIEREESFFSAACQRVEAAVCEISEEEEENGKSTTIG